MLNLKFWINLTINNYFIKFIEKTTFERLSFQIHHVISPLLAFQNGMVLRPRKYVPTSSWVWNIGNMRFLLLYCIPSYTDIPIRQSWFF